jgi:chromosome segregation ATPase
MLRYPKNPTETEKKQIATVQEGIDRNKQRIADAQANITSLPAQMASATEQSTKNAAGLEAIKTSVTTSCK